MARTREEFLEAELAIAIGVALTQLTLRPLLHLLVCAFRTPDVQLQIAEQVDEF